MGELRDLTGRRVLVQVAGDTLAGTVSRSGMRTIRLSGAAALAGGGEAPIDGEVVVMRRHITWLQVL